MLADLHCHECAVRDRSLCSSLAPDQLRRLNGISRRQRVARGTTWIWAGDEQLVCANVISGVMKLTASTADGREQIVGMIYPADFIGCPYPGEVPFGITAMTDAELCVFPRAPFQQMLEDHIMLERMLSQRTLSALEEARHRMLMLARRSAGEKVAAFLLDMADRMTPACRPGTPKPSGFALPLSRSEIADVLGLTIETVSRQFSKLKAEGLIELPGDRLVSIPDPRRLQERADPA